MVLIANEEVAQQYTQIEKRRENV